MKKYYVILIASLAVILRLILALVNKDYTDDHVTPILLWLELGTRPGALDCWECFQPPFFYWIIKSIAQVLNLNTFSEVLNIIRVFNFFLSTTVLLIIIRHISRLDIAKQLKIPLIVFWVLNPELISLGALNTNDMLALLLGCICYLFIQQYVNLKTRKLELLIALIIILLSITKGNGLVYVFSFVAICLIFIIKGIYNRRDVLRLGIIFSVTAILITFLGGYHAKYQNHGNAFVTNQPKQPPPNLIEADTLYKGRKGVTSVYETYFSFRLKSLLEEPFSSNGWDAYPKHRTSLLSQLYGQFNNYFFEFHPKTWRSTNNDMKNFVIANYLLQLPLLLMFLFEFFRRIFRLIRWKISLPEMDAIILGLFLVFLIKYSYTYRDFSTMKLIFLFPAILPMISISGRSLNYHRFIKIIPWLLYATSLLYLVNYIYLIRTLTIQ